MMFVTAELRWILMVVCLVILCLVFVAMLGVAWRQHRKGSPSAPNFHDSLAVELCWALAPMFIVLLLVWPTVRAVQLL